MQKKFTAQIKGLSDILTFTHEYILKLFFILTDGNLK